MQNVSIWNKTTGKHNCPLKLVVQQRNNMLRAGFLFVAFINRNKRVSNGSALRRRQLTPFSSLFRHHHYHRLLCQRLRLRPRAVEKMKNRRSMMPMPPMPSSPPLQHQHYLLSLRPSTILPPLVMNNSLQLILKPS